MKHGAVSLGFRALVAFPCCLAAEASAQELLHSFFGDSPGDLLGHAVSGAGDVDGDGYPDVIGGAYRDDDHGTNSGSARVWSGLTGNELFTFHGDSSNDQFGISVGGAGDVNGDGFADLVVGADRDDNNGGTSGSARVLSGLNGAVLYTFDGDSADDRLGIAVAGAGDVNCDGFGDVIAGAIGADDYGADSGIARVYSGKNGAVLRTFAKGLPGDHLGIAVSGAGDVDGDGWDDVIAGANKTDVNGTSSGTARVYSGRSGAKLHEFHGDSAEDFFGSSVSGAGDVDGDGLPDVVVGAFGDDVNGLDSGSARVFSGVSGAMLHQFAGDVAGDYLGKSVSGAGDVDKDGFADLIVGAHGDDPNGVSSGSARVHSGQTGALLFLLEGESAGDYFGERVSGAGDVNGDGYPDLVVGAWGTDAYGFVTDTGSVRVHSGGSPWADLRRSLAGTHGPPELSGEGTLFAGTAVNLTLENALSNTVGYLVVGTSVLGAPFMGGTFVPDPAPPGFVFPLPIFGPVGQPATLVLGAILPPGVAPGTELHFQYWLVDPAGPAGFAASNALRATTP